MQNILAQSEFQLQGPEQATRGIGLYMNSDKSAYGF